MFYIKYLTMYMHAGAIRKLLYGYVYVRDIYQLAKTHGLSSRTYAQIIQEPTHKLLWIVNKMWIPNHR